MNKQELIDLTEIERDRWKKNNDFYDYEKGRYLGMVEMLKGLEKLDEPDGKIEKLANFIMENIKGEPSKSEGAVETAIRLLSERKLPVIPQFVADYIEKSKTATYSLLGSMSHFSNAEDIHVWIRENQETFARAWLYGYTIEQPKTYRFTLNAFHEIDVTAASFEEAQKNAAVMWNQYFVRQRDFGEAEFEGEVDEDGDLNG